MDEIRWLIKAYFDSLMCPAIGDPAAIRKQIEILLGGPIGIEAHTRFEND